MFLVLWTNFVYGDCLLPFPGEVLSVRGEKKPIGFSYPKARIRETLAVSLMYLFPHGRSSVGHCCFVIFRLNRGIGVRIVFNTESLLILHLHYFRFWRSCGQTLHRSICVEHSPISGRNSVLVESEVVGIGGISKKHQNSRCEVSQICSAREGTRVRNTP